MILMLSAKWFAQGSCCFSNFSVYIDLPRTVLRLVEQYVSDADVWQTCLYGCKLSFVWKNEQNMRCFLWTAGSTALTGARWGGFSSSWRFAFGWRGQSFLQWVGTCSHLVARWMRVGAWEGVVEGWGWSKSRRKEEGISFAAHELAWSICLISFCFCQRCPSSFLSALSY